MRRRGGRWAVDPFTAEGERAAIVYVVTLALIGWLAVRRSHARWWERVLALGILIGLGLLVIALQTLAKLV